MSKEASVEYVVPIHVRGGIQKKPPGYQADLVCLTPRVNGDPPGPVTALAINSSYGLIAYGNESGLVIVDYIQKVCLLSMGTPELYGTADPYQRAPRSPKKLDANRDKDEERSKSPSSDQEIKEEINFEPEKQDLQNDKRAAKARRVSTKHYDESPSCTKESLIDFKKFFKKDAKSRSLSREDTKCRGEEPPLRGSDTPHVQGEGMEEDFTFVEEGREDLSEDLLCETAEEAKETPTEGEDLMTRSQEFHREPTRNPEPIRTRSVESAKKPSKFRFKDHLTKLDARVRRAFSWEHSQNGLSTFYADNEAEVKLNLPVDEGQNSPGAHEPYEAHEPQQTLDVQPIPLLKCSPSTSIPSSPTVSPKGTPRPSPLEEKAFQVKDDDEELESHSIGPTAKTSLELFDNEGNPIPPIRHKVKVGSDHEMKLSAHDDKRKMSQTSSCSGHGDSASHDVTPSRPTEGAMTPTTDEGNHPSANVSSPSNMGAFKTFISHIGKKGSSQGLVDKLDGTSFSRSRSSSLNSLENITSEAVQCLAFADSYSKKNESQLCPTLWVGTSLGSVIQVMVLLPSTTEGRATTPVSVTPSGTIFRLKGSVLAMSFLDCNGALIPYTFESWKDANKEGKRLERTPTKSFVNNRMSPTNSSGEQTFSDRQFMVIASDKLARVVALPSHNCVYKQVITDISFVVKAEIIQMKDAVCLVCYVATGHISIFSLPSLRQLIYVDFLPLVDLRIARTFCFTNYGHGMYLCSPSEIQKFTISSDFCKDMQELLGNLFIPCSTPEPPKQSFSILKGLFGGGVSHLDREELFGESSGKASRGVAKHVSGPSSQIESLNIRTNTAVGEVAKARMQLIERGEKLGQLEDSTAKMMIEAEGFSNTSHNLMLKYKDKKWYQL